MDVEQFLINNLPYYYLDFVYKPLAGTLHPAPYVFYCNICADKYNVVHKTLLSSLDEKFQKITIIDNYQKYPVVSIFFSQGFYAWPCSTN